MGQYSKTPPVEANRLYHIYNHAVGSEVLFRQEKDYLRFLEGWEERLKPVSDIYAYCLLPNHFHIYLKLVCEGTQFSKAMSDLCNSYSRYFNTKYDRMGSLFMKPYKRRLAESDADRIWMPWYIHRNPLHHGFAKDWRNYKWSSYRAYTTSTPSLLKKEFLVELFGSVEKLIAHHELNASAWKLPDVR